MVEETLPETTLALVETAPMEEVEITMDTLNEGIHLLDLKEEMITAVPLAMIPQAEETQKGLETLQVGQINTLKSLS